jgi:ATP-dependent RNA helicase DeaD
VNLLFNELPILNETKQAIEKLGLIETTQIQHHAIPVMLAGQDMIGQAQTGTGKTFAFAIPIIEKINIDQKQVQALIICPTRELTIQVYKEFVKLLEHNKQVKIASIYGGESYQKQYKALAQNPHIIVATPGRTIDHLNQGKVDFSNLKILVLDEADEMLKMGFQEDLETILKDTPKTRQTALFSATIPPFIKKIANNYQNQPKMIKIETPTLTVDLTDQYVYFIKKSDRDQLLMRVLDYYQPHSTLIFANTKKDVDELTSFLVRHDYEADAIHGDLKQSQRDDVIGRFRNKRLKYLVATDVAARGLDISHIDLVINYELPFELEVYVHRIGRTGRAGKTGMSISFVYPSMKHKLAMLERFIQAKMIEKEIPQIDDIHKKQKASIYLDVKSLVKNNTDTNNDILEQLTKDGFDKEQIINALLQAYQKPLKTYAQIEIPRSKQKEVIKKDKVVTKQKQMFNYRLYQINLGKQDGLRPVTFLEYLKKHADIYAKNIGDIFVDQKTTTFEIHPAAIKRLDMITNKFFNGKKIKPTPQNQSNIKK